VLAAVVPQQQPLAVGVGLAAGPIGILPSPPGASSTSWGSAIPLTQPRSPSINAIAARVGVRRWSVPRTGSPWNR
jgi:hypothetical protein